MESLSAGRTGFEQLGQQYPAAAGVTFENLSIAQIPCTWVRPAGVQHADVVVYIHGGGFIYGSARSHAAMVSHIATALGRNILLIDYRLAPEHPFPAAIDDGVAVISALMGGPGAARFGMIGDSAGGNLCMAIQVRLKESAGPLPRYSILVSPWADLECKSDSYNTNQDHDLILNKPYLQWAAGLYAGANDLRAALLSPVNAPLEGLAPVQILYGTAEILADDSIHLHQQLLAAGNPSVLQAFADAQHVWPFIDINTTAAQQALQAMQSFADAHSS